MNVEREPKKCPADRSMSSILKINEELVEEISKLKEISLKKDNKIYKYMKQLEEARKEIKLLVAQVQKLTDEHKTKNIKKDLPAETDGNAEESFDSVSEGAKCNGLSSFVAQMNGLSVNQNTKQNSKSVNTPGKTNIRFVPPLSSTMKNVNCHKALDISDEDLFIPETPFRQKTRVIKSPERRQRLLRCAHPVVKENQKSPKGIVRNIFKSVEQNEIRSQSSSGNSSGYSDKEPCEESSYSESDNSGMSAKLHATFSIASEDCWLEPDLEVLKITGHNLYKQKSGFVLVKIQQDKQRQLIRACKQRNLLHYVAKITGEKYIGSNRIFKAVFFKSANKYQGQFVENHNMTAFELSEDDVVCYLPIPKRINGKLIFKFNFTNYYLDAR